MRIAAVIASMQAGGAERVMSLLTGYWARQGNQVLLLTYEEVDSRPFYALEKHVEYRPLGLAKVSETFGIKILNTVRRLSALRRAIFEAKPDVVVSFCVETNVMVLVATRGFRVPVVVSERVEPALYGIEIFWSVGRRMLYPFAERIVVQSRSAREFFPASLHKRCVIIPNPIPETARTDDNERQLRVLAVGRLTAQKGFDILIEAFASIHSRYPNWILRIVGEGEGRPNLEAMVLRLGLEKTIEMPGVVRDMLREYQTASVFVLSSRFEGFPNALCEAMSAGLPVVAVACSGAVTEIVSNGVAGLLVSPGDGEALVRAIDRMLADAEMRRHFGIGARVRVAHYSPGVIWPLWQNCLDLARQSSAQA